VPEIGEKIRALREAKGLSRKAFGELVGISEPKVQALEIGKQRVDHVALANISSKLEVDANWLLDNKSSEPPTNGFSETPAMSYISPEAAADFVAVPRYNVDVSAGKGALAQDENVIAHYAFSRRWLSRRNLNPDNLAVVRVSGDSMEPRLSDGDLAVIDVTDTDLRDGVTYVFRLGTDLLIKRLQILPQDHVNLCSHNVEFDPILVHLGDGELVSVGRVVASMHEW
jgi:phage repressor protein C with HTH and peptisase S24 domain